MAGANGGFVMHGDFIVIGYPHTEVFCFAVAGEHIAHGKRCVFLRLFIIQFNGCRFLCFGGGALCRHGRGRSVGGAARRLCFGAVRRLAVALAAVGLGCIIVRRDQIIRHGHGGRGGVRYFVIYERTAKG